jgi:DNA-binding MarR family transcriptional regulator
MKVAKKHEGCRFSSFELTKHLLNNLQQFKITQTAKLVLLYLADCYNPKKADMFPKQKTIAEKLGVSEISVTRAISELHKEGLIISERKYTNRYNFTSRILSERAIVKQNKLIEKKYQNDNKEPIKMIAHDKEQIKRTNKEQTNVVELQKTDVQILQEYAKEHGATNIQGYINALKIKGVAADIIRQYREKEGVSKYWERQAAQTSELIKQMQCQKCDPMPESFRALKAKLKTACNYQM